MTTLVQEAIQESLKELEALMTDLKKEKKRKWLGTWPARCDLCQTDLHTTPWFVDGKTTEGPWALLCPLCFSHIGVGLGQGRGQKYSSSTLEKLEG